VLLSVAGWLVGCATTPTSDEPAPDSPLDAVSEARERAVGKPNDAQAKYDLGNALYDAGNVAGAAAAYRTAVSLDPSLAKAHTNLGLCLRRLGDPVAAMAAYETALALDPDDVVTWGNPKVAAGDAQDAEAYARAVEAVARLKPDDLLAQGEYADWLMAEQRFAEASAVYERIVALAPEQTDDYYNLGLCHYELGAWALAAAAWELGHARAPYHPPINRGLSVAYWRLGQFDKAWAAVDRCEDLGIALDPEFIQSLQADAPRP